MVSTSSTSSLQRDPVQVRLREAREICSPREILAQQAVGVLVAAALPRTAWIAEIDLHVGGDGEVLVVSHLLAAIPGQGAAQLLRQFAYGRGLRPLVSGPDSNVPDASLRTTQILRQPLLIGV